MPLAPLVIGMASAVSRLTSVSTRVTMAKYTPRSRKIGSPISTESRAQKVPARGRVHQKLISPLVIKIADT